MSESMSYEMPDEMSDEMKKISNKENKENLQNLKNRQHKKEYIPFWAENPNILVSPKYVVELFPTNTMTFYQSLNAISRSVILLSLFTFVYTRNNRIVLIAFLTLLSIYLFYYYKKQEKKRLESFQSPALEVISDNKLDDITFDTPTPLNPFSNVLVSDIDSNPYKRPAPPTFGEETYDTIMDSAKQLIIEQNPGQPDIADKLFRDLGNQMVFEQSLQPFYSNASTTVPNDQSAFAEFCYGEMISCKEGNQFACARNLDRYTN